MTISGKEETEVKNLEWLKEEITEILLTSKKDGTNYFYYRDLKERIYNAINQLDEPEVLFQEENINIVLDDLKEHIKEQQSLSQNVGLAHTSAGNDTHYRQYDYVLECINEYEPSDDLQNLLVPKQDEREQLEIAYKDILSRKEFLFDDKRYVVVEKPTIPKFVAEAIEEDKECGYDVYESIDLILGTNGGGLPSISDWVARNIDKYANAWLNGFTVEKEPLYRARLKVITDEFISSYLRTQSSDAEDRLKALEIGSKYIHEDYRHLSEFTEDELKRLDIWDSKQWELEEMEE